MENGWKIEGEWDREWTENGLRIEEEWMENRRRMDEESMENG